MTGVQRHRILGFFVTYVLVNRQVCKFISDTRDATVCCGFAIPGQYFTIADIVLYAV